MHCGVESGFFYSIHLFSNSLDDKESCTSKEYILFHNLKLCCGLVYANQDLISPSENPTEYPIATVVANRV